MSDPAVILYILQGLRPELPNHGHPKLLELMQRCWEAIPIDRPSFNEITVKLENILQEMEVSYINVFFLKVRANYIYTPLTDVTLHPISLPLPYADIWCNFTKVIICPNNYFYSFCEHLI